MTTPDKPVSDWRDELIESLRMAAVSARREPDCPVYVCTFMGARIYAFVPPWKDATRLWEEEHGS